MFNCFLFVFDLFKLFFILFRITLWPSAVPFPFGCLGQLRMWNSIVSFLIIAFLSTFLDSSQTAHPTHLAAQLLTLAMTYGIGNKTCRGTGKLTCILESYIYSYQTWFTPIKRFAKTDTVKILHTKKFKVCDLDPNAMYWDGDCVEF